VHTLHYSTDCTTRRRSPAEAKDFYSSLCVKTSSEAHPASYRVDTGGPFPGGNVRPGVTDYSSPSIAEIMNK
jgi:hypothetical protein